MSSEKTLGCERANDDENSIWGERAIIAENPMVDERPLP